MNKKIVFELDVLEKADIIKKKLKMKPEKNSKKVHCRNCKYYRFMTMKCIHPSNFVILSKWIFKQKTTICPPYIRNIGNNCKDYKRKGWKFWMR